MKLDETRVPLAGNFRCCLASVGHEYTRKNVEVGDVSECEFCHRKFVLTDRKIWEDADETGRFCQGL